MTRSRPPRCPSGRGCPVCTDPDIGRRERHLHDLAMREAAADARWFRRDDAPSEPHRVSEPDVVLHVLWHGEALCGEPPGIPRDWPPGHRWVRSAAAATCRTCRVALDRFELASDAMTGAKVFDVSTTLDELIGRFGFQRGEVSEPGFALLYVRASGATPRVLSIVDMTAEAPGAGALTRLLARLADDHPAMVVRVENVPTHRLASYLERQGFTGGGIGSSYWRYPK